VFDQPVIGSGFVTAAAAPGQQESENGDEEDMFDREGHNGLLGSDMIAKMRYTITFLFARYWMLIVSGRLRIWYAFPRGTWERGRVSRNA
jgi:hypothetical protein